MEKGLLIIAVICLVAILSLVAIFSPSTTGAVVKEDICEKNFLLCLDHAEKDAQKSMCLEIFALCMQFGP